jgi:hypothetical protein
MPVELPSPVKFISAVNPSNELSRLNQADSEYATASAGALA